MAYNNKLHLHVRKDTNGWFNFSKKQLRVQLCGDTRKDGFFLTQYANKLGKKEFMKDFTEILAAMEKDNKPIFTAYELTEIINGRLEK